ncbi:hypothetical protein [Acetobacter fabarum]|uniref:hypothetical protein n=1 Tax=Acetobacter fabarum TaxID=483199 RepID=UPI0020A15441|nr:hypothetical protein [Acetobacter fabarum]MCP1229434.1 hypothetical protein [Acetobacter fabarum]MCP1234952.1 hypothetical protein [Acetobacter fabarum]
MSVWYSTYPSTRLAVFGSDGVVTGWVECTPFAEKPDWLPDADQTAAVPDDVWKNRATGYWQVKNGVFSQYTPPTVTVPLKTQAVSAQAWIQQQANLASAMAEVFTADMKAYVKAIAAIANGTDTTSTALPAQPADVMAAATT